MKRPESERVNSSLRLAIVPVFRANTMTLRWQDSIEERKDVMRGKPVFKGHQGLIP
jgi:hypothetical protein